MAKIRKALVAGLGALVASLVAVLSAQHRLPTAGDVVIAAGLGVAAGLAVWSTPNAKTDSVKTVT